MGWQLLHLSFGENPIGVLLAAVPAGLNLAILAYGIRALPRDLLTRLFLFFVATLVAWQGFDIAVRSATNPETAALWRALLRAGQFFAIPAGLHFCLVFAEREKLASQSGVLALLYLPPIVFSSCYSAGFIVEELVHVPVFGWIADPDQGPVYAAMTAWYALEAAAMPLVLYAHAWRTRGDPSQRGPARILALGITIPVGIGVVTEAILPQLFAVQQIPITSTTISVFSVATAVALGRYRLLHVRTLAAARAVLDTMSDALIIADSDGRVLYGNPIAQDRFAPAGSSQRRGRLWDLMPGGRPTWPDAVWASVLAGEQVSALGAELVGADGRAFPALVSLAPVEVRRRGPPGVVLLVHDVPELQAIQARLAEALDAARAANESKSMFLANMSHELRTPLNAIIGYSEFLSEEANDRQLDDLLPDLQRIERSGHYLLQLINDVLDLSKVEAGHMEVEQQAVDLGALLEELEPMARNLAAKNANELVLEVEPVPAAHADRRRVRQVLINLMSNAAKFTESGQIHVRLRGHGADSVAVDIADTGLGMDEEQLGRLFDAFAQVHRVQIGRYGGTGLGLALSRNLCVLMGGGIDVHSAPSLGSTFTVHLPVAPQV